MEAGGVHAATMRHRAIDDLDTSQSGLIFAAACLAVVLFALVPASTRIAGLQLDGLSIGLIRTVGAGLLTAPLLVIWRLRPPNGLKDIGLLLLYALGNFAAFPILFSLGTERTSGAHAALIMAVTPLLVAIIGIILNRHLPRWSWFLGIAIAVMGEAALVGSGSLGTVAGATIAGDAIVFAGCASSAIGLAAGARLGSRMNPLAGAFWAMAIAAVGLAPFAAVHTLTAPYQYSDLTWTTWAAVIQITLGAAVLANIALVWAFSKGGLVRVAPLQFAQPVCALFFASALLDEPLTLSFLFVAAAIAFGIVIASRATRPYPITNEPARPLTDRIRSVARYLSPMFLEEEQGHERFDNDPQSTGAAPSLRPGLGQSLNVGPLSRSWL
jgi:drug/metabolite transporter (DMT)-like permease